MKSMSLRRLSRFYIWIILLILAVIFFILLKSPAAGQRQASQGPTGLSVSAFDEASQSSGQSSAGANPAEPDAVSVPSPADDDSLKPLPEVLPDPIKLPQIPVCPLLSGELGPYSWHCQPCKPFPYEPPAESMVVCLDSNVTSAAY